MRNNIRRSILVAAAATGIWALGTAAANAAELPDVPAADHVTGTVTSTVGGAGKTAGDTLPTDGVKDVTNGVADTSKVTDAAGKTVDGAKATVDGAASKVTGAAKGALPGVGDVTGLTDGLTKGATDKADLAKTAKTAKEAKKTVKKAQKAAKKAADLDLPTGEVPGVVPQLPGLGSLPSVPVTPSVPTLPSVPGELPAVPATPDLPATPGSADDLLAALSGAGVRPEELTGKAQRTLGDAQSTVGGVAPGELPPAGNDAVGQAIPVVQQTAGDAGVLADDAYLQLAPFAGNLANGAEGDATGLAGDSVLLVQGLTLTVTTDGQILVGNAVSGAETLVPALPGDLTDAANVPALPALSALPSAPATPADLPAVPDAGLPTVPAAELPTVPADLPTVPAELPTVDGLGALGDLRGLGGLNV